MNDKCKHKNKAYSVVTRQEVLGLDKRGIPNTMGNVTRIYTYCVDCGLLLKSIQAKYVE